MTTAKFSVGQLIHHKMFGYRGVVVGVDPTFDLTDEWYEEVARSRPPKDAPWYQVLVHDSDQTTYVAERNLEPDTCADPIQHPLIDDVLGPFLDGHYADSGPVH